MIEKDLFQELSLQQFINSRNLRIQNEINRIPTTQLKNINCEIYTKKEIEKYKINIPNLDRSTYNTDRNYILEYNRGRVITVEIISYETKFTGDVSLFDICTKKSENIFIKYAIIKNSIFFFIKASKSSKTEIGNKNIKENALFAYNFIDDCLSEIKKSIETIDENLQKSICFLIQKKVEHLTQQEKINDDLNPFK